IDYDKDNIFAMAMTPATGNVLNNPSADELSTYLVNPGNNQFLLNTLPLDLSNMEDILDELSFIKAERPAIAVAHKVTSNDTSWIVDVKVKFLKDTVSDYFQVETYMLADIPAKLYTDPNIDLRTGAAQGLIS